VGSCTYLGRLKGFFRPSTHSPHEEDTQQAPNDIPHLRLYEGETYSSPVVTIFTFTRTPSFHGPTSVPKWAGPQTFPANRFFRGFVFFCRFLVGFQLVLCFSFSVLYFLLYFRFSFLFLNFKF
jgi:hypothetical protein